MTLEVHDRQAENPSIEQTRFVLIAGPLGAGKTTFINSLLDQHDDRLGSVAVIVNDFGAENIDATRIRADAIRGLSHECVCCGSWREFGDTLVELNGDYHTVIIEPTGVADPKRIHGVARDKGITLHTIAVTDARNLEHNDSLGLQGPAIEVADQVVVSRLNDGEFGELEIPSDVEEYITEIRRDLSPVALSSDQVPAGVLDTLLSDSHIERGVETEHRHGEHGPGHAFARLTLNLHPEVTRDEIAIALREFSGPLERAKGVASDGAFDFVNGEFSSFDHETGSSRASLKMILISSDLEMSFSNFIAIGLPPAPELSDIHNLAKLYPDVNQVVRNGEKLLPHFEEADAAYARMWAIREVSDEIPSITQREAFHEKWKLALAKYLNYRVEVVDAMSRGEDLGAENESQRPYLNKEIGLLLAWHALNYADDISPEQQSAILACRPAAMFFEGCASAQDPSILEGQEDLSDDVISGIVEVAKYGLQFEGLNKEQMLKQLDGAASVMGDRWDRIRFERMVQAIAEIDES